jgi:predicted AlkP superfamily phosphohydrolase/phosphomutase
VAGREPNGIVPKDGYEALRRELIQKLEAIPDENGKPIGTVVHKPEDLYKVRNGIAPDLLAYFGNLAWRSAGTVGSGQLHTFENDTGPDDANHAQHGIFIVKPSGAASAPRRYEGLQIADMAPTILQEFGLPIPSDMEGKPISIGAS